MANEQSYNSAFEPESCFFTEPTSISQDINQAFGPVNGSEENQFRLTAKFNSTGAEAYAICKGVVLIQPQTGSIEKVNLILRPYSQPVQGINIKYFIYRGLNKADFFDTGNVIIEGAGSSELIGKIQAEYRRYYDIPPGETPGFPFTASLIGYNPTHPTQADETTLDFFFFKNSEYVEENGEEVEIEATSFQLPMVDKGTSLGHFMGECGMDVVINYGDYTLPANIDDGFIFNLAYARAAEAIIDISSITDNYQRKLKKEQVCQFLDIAAYFGFHHCEKGKVIVRGSDNHVVYTQDDIYNNVLANFITKNNWYIYIQSDRGRSYNFYGNYAIEEGSPKSLKFGIEESGIADAPFGTYGWPLLRDTMRHPVDGTKNKLYLQFTTDNNYNTSLYGQAATIDNAQKNNFCGLSNLILPPDTEGVPSKFTKTIILSTPAITEGSDNVNVSGFSILIYQGKAYKYQVSAAFESNTHPMIDDVFNLLFATPILKANAANGYSLLISQKQQLINYYSYQRSLGCASVQTLKVVDTLSSTDNIVRVLYLTEAVNVMSDATNIMNDISAETKTSPSLSGAVSANKMYRLPYPYFYELKLFTDEGKTISGLELKTEDGSVPNKIILGLTQEEDLALQQIMSDDFRNYGLVLQDFIPDKTEYDSPENIRYQKYRIGVVVEIDNGSLALFFVSEDIIIYTIDRQYYYTKAYSDNMPQYTMDGTEELLLSVNI